MIFRFAHPVALFLFALPLLLWLLGRTGWWERKPSLIVFSDIRLMDNLPVGWRVRLRWLPDALRGLAWVILVIALARPQTGNTQEIIRGQGVDIVLALDISGSMREAFESSNRLEAARSVIGEFIQGRDFDRIGLVVFARDAFHQSPPTLDYEVLVRLLNEVRLAPDLNLDDGTAIGLGLASAANMLRSSDAASRVVILLTDGAHNADGLAPVDAAQMLDTLGIRVYTIGMGNVDAVPVAVAGDTQFVENGLDEATLKEVAEITQGLYFRAVDLDNLRAIYDQIDRLEQSDVERQIFVRWEDQIAFSLLPFSFILLIMERLLRHTAFQTVP